SSGASSGGSDCGSVMVAMMPARQGNFDFDSPKVRVFENNSHFVDFGSAGDYHESGGDSRHQS
ncbi:hypothetical protein, partial [Variovorax sp. WDL1]|uniref:hypothetical protein n=1 Tax=Variovorax sp. WDL1 TaxID=207745 RepID=UPI001E5C2988